MIRAQNRLFVCTRHHSVGDGFVPCEFGSPGPRAHCIPMDRAPGLPPTAVRPHLPANEECPWLGWEKNRDLDAALFSSHPVGRHTTFVRERVRPCSDSGADGICTYHECAGRDTKFARHEAVPDRVMASANAQPIPRPNHGPKSGGPDLAKQPSKGPAKSALMIGACAGRITTTATPSPFARKRGMSPLPHYRSVRAAAMSEGLTGEAPPPNFSRM